MIVKKIKIYNDKIDNKVKIALISDIHFSDYTKMKTLNRIHKNIQSNNPNYICIVGDIIDDNSSLKNIDNMKLINSWINNLSLVCPVIIVLGNHDYLDHKTGSFIYPTNWINELKNIDNVYVLDNKVKVFNNICFYGYEAPFKYYIYNGKHTEDTSFLIDDFNKKLKIKNNNKYNILLFHSPIRIFSDKCINEINNFKNINLILTGHMHNGLVPIFLDKIIPKNKGFVGPYRSFFPKLARGIVKKDNQIMIISGGVIKLAKSASKLMAKLNFIYPAQIEYIEIKK